MGYHSFIDECSCNQIKQITTTEYTIHTALSLAAEDGKDEMVKYLQIRGGKSPKEL